MSALAVLLIAVISWIWIYPERFGRWMRKVRNGYGNTENHTYIHIGSDEKAALRESECND
ncbi:hypothetical protein I2750_19865 [Bacillus sp. PR5]|nr:hypothetical protein [Bacillus sp. PR5]